MAKYEKPIDLQTYADAREYRDQMEKRAVLVDPSSVSGQRIKGYLDRVNDADQKGVRQKEHDELLGRMNETGVWSTKPSYDRYGNQNGTWLVWTGKNAKGKQVTQYVQRAKKNYARVGQFLDKTLDLTEDRFVTLHEQGYSFLMGKPSAYTKTPQEKEAFNQLEMERRAKGLLDGDVSDGAEKKRKVLTWGEAYARRGAEDDAEDAGEPLPGGKTEGQRTLDDHAATYNEFRNYFESTALAKLGIDLKQGSWDRTARNKLGRFMLKEGMLDGEKYREATDAWRALRSRPQRTFAR